MSGEAKGTSLLTSLEAAPAPIEGSTGEDGAESGGEVPSTLLTNQTPLQTGEPVQVVTPQETDAEGERPGPMSRPAEAALPAQPAVPPDQAASASAAQGVSVESGQRQGSIETSAVKSTTPAQPVVPLSLIHI